MKLRSTSGQSKRSVVIAMCGKLTDFLATYGLVLPIQYVVMAYFSSSVAYVNGIQVVWYYNNQRDQLQRTASKETIISRNIETITNSDCEDSHPVDQVNTVDEALLSPSVNSQQCRRKTASNNTKLKYGILMCICLFLSFYIVGLIWATKTFLSLLAPFSILLVLSVSFLYFNREYLAVFARYRMDCDVWRKKLLSLSMLDTDFSGQPLQKHAYSNI